MLGFALKTTLEVAAIILLLVGYLNEEKVVAFERALWKRLRSGSAKRPAAHSATYYASREAQREEQRKRERIARGAEYARAHAIVLRSEDEPRRVA